MCGSAPFVVFWRCSGCGGGPDFSSVGCRGKCAVQCLCKEMSPNGSRIFKILAKPFSEGRILAAEGSIYSGRIINESSVAIYTRSEKSSNQNMPTTTTGHTFTKLRKSFPRLVQYMGFNVIAHCFRHRVASRDCDFRPCSNNATHD